MLDKLLNLVFPQSCPLCKSPSINHKFAPICERCWEEIPLYNGPFCNRCGILLSSDVSTICGGCMTDEPPFEHVRSYGLYDGVIKEAIKLLKYDGVRRLAIPLSELLLKLPLPRIDVIVYVPLTKKRLKERGFNQSALIARNISKRIDKPLLINSLIKIRDTLPQVGMNMNERRRNVKGAFSVQDAKSIFKKRVLLIDDVITTGSTVMECSRVLKKAGAESIHVLTIARSLMD